MCSRSCARVLLFVFNFLFFLGGVLLLAFGIAGLANPQGLQNFLTGIPGVKNMGDVINIPAVIVSSSVFMIILGSVLLVFGFLGCAGACFQSKWMLFFYWVFLIVVILAEIALIIVAAVSPAKMEEQTTKYMYESLHKKFRPVSINGTTVTLPDDVVAVSWVSLQFEVGCCGVKNFSDFYNDQTFLWNNITYNLGNAVIQARIPPSCCKQTSKMVPKSTTSFVNLEGCLKTIDADAYYAQGCYDTVSQLVVKYSYIPISICAIVIFLEVIAIAAAIYLWRTDDHQKKNVV